MIGHKEQEVINPVVKKYPNGIAFGLLAGHGGMVNGKYVTAPAKMFKFPDGLTIYEGVENRKRLKAIVEQSKMTLGFNSDVVNIVPEEEDISLAERVRRINKIFTAYASRGILFVLSEIHANAGEGTGYEAFTTPGYNFSDIMKAIWCDEMAAQFPNNRFRGEKEMPFRVIKNIDTYGFLQESYFFDNRKDVELMCNPKGIEKEALASVATMVRLADLWKE